MSALFDLKGRTAVVVGGTSGIGQALSLGLADAGADVIASSRRPDAVQQTALEIEARQRRTLRVISDVREPVSLVHLRDAVLKEFGKVDILVNCAGITKRGPTLDYPEQTWRDILETNLTGTLHGCQIFGKPMLERRYGRIINIASLSSYLGLFEVAAYGASKAAVASLSKSLAVEWSRHGVMVNAILPGLFRTEMNAQLLDDSARGREFLLRSPIGRWGKVEELVGAAVFLASEAASFVSGHLLAVDGGFLASGVNQ
jgi:NAD(P)-dependent dehydrogenase (short-subunit alcohol dehydrogenase family)